MRLKHRDFSIIELALPLWFSKAAGAFGLLLVFLLIIYGNSFQCSWHFDDFANIYDNTSIHLKDLSWSSLVNSGSGITGSDRLSRPVAYMSFALNYYIGGLNVYGYHIVNFIIHFMCSFFLYLFVLQLLQTPILQNRYASCAHSIALLAAFLWAVNPLQVFAVTLIVQRMASLAALLYLMAMYFYLKARAESGSLGKFLFWALCATTALLSFGTKENTAMLPVSILFLELMLIQGIRRKSLVVAGGILFIAGVFLLLYGIFWFGDLQGIIGDYSVRGFNAVQRLMTQPRVFFYYISLLFYPVSSRLMLIDDLEVSQSLLVPLDTLFAIAGLGVLLAFIVIYSRRWPLLCFCMLFFFLNHIIEGSFTSLEMIYYHRNYLPSLLLFVPVAIGILNLIDYYTERTSMLVVLTVSLVFYLIIQGVTVYIQNDVFRDELSLWSDNAKKMSHLHRTRQNHGIALLNAGLYEEGLAELKEALNGKLTGSNRHLCLTYSTIGQAYQVMRQFSLAWPYYHKAITACPEESSDVYMQRAMSFVFIRMARMALDEGRAGDAELIAGKAIRMHPQQLDYRLTLSDILLKQGKSQEAIQEAQAMIRINPGMLKTLEIFSKAYSLKGDTYRAEYFKNAFLNLQKAGF